MSRASRQVVVMGLVALVAGLLGAFVGARMLTKSAMPPLHQLVHHDLVLDAPQRARIDALEATFAIRKRVLELDMRSANAELAGAIQTERGYGPKVTAAIDHFHTAMGQLQKETIEHVFAMRAVLTPAQAAKLDGSVVKALTADPA